MKTNTVFKRGFNQVLDIISGLAPGDAMASENDLAQRLEVSRTTVRKVLRELETRNIIGREGAGKAVLRPPCDSDLFPDAETVSPAAQVEIRFMEWMLRGDLKPGTAINALELGRQFGVSTTGVREFLNRFARFGLIERRPNARWVFKGFTKDFALELFDIREVFEMRSALAFARQAPEHPAWIKLAAIRRQHEALMADIDRRFHDFSDLDNRFHRLVNDASRNRFIEDFYDIIAFIFHYHYQWNKRLEKQRNTTALEEHLSYIDALVTRDPVKVEASCRRHLETARKTLLASVIAEEG